MKAFRFNLIFLFAIILMILSSCKKESHYTAIQDFDPSKNTFVGGQTCIECHQNEFEKWSGSHHDKAMAIADSTSVLGDFNNSTFTHKGVTTAFFKKEGKFYANTEGPDGEYHDYEIMYTFGFTPLQQYIVQFPKGHYQCLLTAWDSDKNKWFHLQPDLDLHHEEWMHWSRGAMNWNNMCADCHSTNLEKAYDPKTLSYNTSFSEINVNCEACHGPSSQHVEYYKQGNPVGKPPKLYMQTGMASEEFVQKCARCHSRRGQLTKKFDYKGHFFDHYEQQLLNTPIYYADGQIWDEDYVYASFVQSKMYQEGVSCKDCHDPHSLTLKRQGNNLCITCHVKQDYDTPSHHFHIQNTEASQCINCHMTGRYYMGNDFRRDHSFRVPRPDQSVTHETPNACNGCHTDKSAEWAANVIVEKYGKERADHFSDHLLSGLDGNLQAYHHLIGNSNYPEIARATAVNQLINQQITQEDVDKLLTYLNDDSPWVRKESIQAIEQIGINEYHSYLEPLLNDSVRMVRIAAARYFSLNAVDMSSNADFDNAYTEYKDRLEMTSDFPGGQLQIALLQQAQGDIKGAIKSYERAIEIDNRYNQARMNLALLYYQTGYIDKSETLYKKVITQEPDFAMSYYMLGLLYNEKGESDKSLDYLKISTEKPNTTPNAFYNYALKLIEIKDFSTAELSLKQGLDLFPKNERLMYVKAIVYANSKQYKKAETAVNELIKRYPANPTYQNLRREITKNR